MPDDPISKEIRRNSLATDSELDEALRELSHGGEIPANLAGRRHRSVLHSLSVSAVVDVNSSTVVHRLKTLSRPVSILFCFRRARMTFGIPNEVSIPTDNAANYFLKAAAFAPQPSMQR